MERVNLDKIQLLSAYTSGGTIAEIAKSLDCSKHTVHAYLDEYGIKRRKQSTSNNLLLRPPILTFDDKKIPPQWLVGFIDGEGSFIFRREKNQKRIYPMFSVSQKNRHLLEKIALSMKGVRGYIQESRPTGVYNLVYKGFKSCVCLSQFFDIYHPIAKEDQYKIWKLMMEHLINNDLSWQEKEKLWWVYKTYKKYDDFSKHI